MPLAGTGMLLTSMNIDASDEADFNRWYDREHLEERVAIEGFWKRGAMSRTRRTPNICRSIRPRRWTCSTAPPTGRGSPTRQWSRRTMAHFKNMLRVVARTTISKGTGRGAALGVVRLRRPPTMPAAWRDALQEKLAQGIAKASSRCICSRASRNCRAQRRNSSGAQRRRARLVRADRRHACRCGLRRHRRTLHRPCCGALPAAGLCRHLQPDVGLAKSDIAQR